jgi:hypothetical protein
VVISLDEMGPEAAKSYPGKQLVRAAPEPSEDAAIAPAERAKQAADYGRRGKGYIFGAFRPATGAALTHPYERRTSVNWVDFLEKVDGWVEADAERVYAIVDNLNAHRATDVLLFSLNHPRWEESVPAKVRCLSELDRALVEDLALAGLKRPSLRELGRDLPSG